MTAVTIRLEADWGLPPYYVDEGDGHFALHTEGPFARRFDLPEQVICAIEAWNKLYQDILDWSDPRGSGWARPEDKQHFYEQGRAAARLLRRHLPPDVEILYVGDGNIPDEYY